MSGTSNRFLYSPVDPAHDLRVEGDVGDRAKNLPVLDRVHPDAIKEIEFEFHFRRSDKNERRPVDQIRRQNVFDD